MVKGCERRVVVYKSNNSKYFYEAYFFIKPELCRRDYKKSDIAEEAQRIIEESVFGSAKRKKRKGGVVLLVCVFLFGCMLSSLVTLFVCSAI